MSATGGVDMASSVMGADPSTVTPQPSASTPLQKVKIIIIEQTEIETIISETSSTRKTVHPQQFTHYVREKLTRSSKVRQCD